MALDLDSFFDYPGTEHATPQPAAAPFLSTCSADEWEVIRAHTDSVRYDAGASVVAQGSLERTLVILLRGQLEVLETRGRREKRIALLDAGSVVGDHGFLDGEPSNATVRAVGEADVLRLPLARFEVLAAKDPQLGLYILFDLGRLVSHRLRAAEEVQRRTGR